MSSPNFIVPPRSWGDIGRKAMELRAAFGMAGDPHFPINDFIEIVLDQRLSVLRFEVEDRAAMMGAEGYTDPNGEFIILREDVYRDGVAGEGRARFTAAHELGHFVLHTKIPLMRAPVGQAVKPYRLSEPQANCFAAEILMPDVFFQPADTVQSVMARHGTSYEAARLRIQCIFKRRGWPIKE